MRANGEFAAEVSRLYWESDESVAEITDQLDISRRTLYDILQPLPAGGECPQCGSALVYANRSARSAREASCPSCGLGAEREAAVRTGGAASDGDAAEQELVAAGSAPIDADGALLRSRAVLLGGAALAGVALGAVAALLVSRRD